MARMIPKKLSSTTKSNAEKTLFQIVEKNLSDDYVVFMEHGGSTSNISFKIGKLTSSLFIPIEELLY